MRPDWRPPAGPAPGQRRAAELRRLVRAALDGLNPAEREVIELGLRHDLQGADLAAVLGVPRNQAHDLASRARGQLEKALGALLVARTGRRACPDLDLLLDGWDGRLTAPTRKRVGRSHRPVRRLHRPQGRHAAAGGAVWHGPAGRAPARAARGGAGAVRRRQPAGAVLPAGRDAERPGRSGPTASPSRPGRPGRGCSRCPESRRRWAS